MQINREIIREKINGYLNNKIAKQAIYEWALSAAVSEDSAGLAKRDPLCYAALNAMVEINRKDDPLKELQYYGRCLSGEAEFVPVASSSRSAVTSKEKNDFSVTTPTPFTLTQLPKYIKEWKYFQDTLLTARLYVIIFAVCSFVVQVSSIMNPGFMQIGLWVPSQWQALLDAFPHMVYAGLVLLPPRRIAQERNFIFAFPVLILGVIFYWRISLLIMWKLSLSWIFILVILPFSVIPAILALILLLAEKSGFTKITK